MKTYSVRPAGLTRTTPRPLILRVFTATELVECCAPATPLFGADDEYEPPQPAATSPSAASIATVAIRILTIIASLQSGPRTPNRTGDGVGLPLRGRADDQRLGELRRLGKDRPLELRDVEARGLDRRKCRPIAIAMDDEPVQPVHPILETHDARVVGTHVLEEQKPTARPENAPHLAERPR